MVTFDFETYIDMVGRFLEFSIAEDFDDKYTALAAYKHYTDEFEERYANELLEKGILSRIGDLDIAAITSNLLNDPNVQDLCAQLEMELHHLRTMDPYHVDCLLSAGTSMGLSFEEIINNTDFS